MTAPAFVDPLDELDVNAATVDADPLVKFTFADDVAVRSIHLPVAIANDSVGAATLADPDVRAHVVATHARGRAAARAAIQDLRVAAVPAAVAAAAPFAKLLAANEERFRSGELARRFGGDASLAQRAYEVEREGLRHDRTAAIADAIEGLGERLTRIEATAQAAAAGAGELPVPTAGAVEALKVLIDVLPVLAPTVAVDELTRAVNVAARDAGARGNLRYLTPILRSLIERPEYGEATQVGADLRLVLRRAEALGRAAEHVTAAYLGRYAARLRHEFGVVARVVGEHGAWKEHEGTEGNRALGAVIPPPPVPDEPPPVPDERDAPALNRENWRRFVRA
jgi:hypothetical protein